MKFKFYELVPIVLLAIASAFVIAISIHLALVFWRGL